MIRLFVHIMLIVGVNILLGVSYCMTVQRDRLPDRWETLGTLFLIGHSEHHNNVFLGSSYSFSFSRCAGAHQRFEYALQEPFHNLSTPGSGVLPAKLFLEQYFARGNTARDVIYFADAPFFYSRLGNENWGTLEHQPFEIGFLFSCIRNRVEFFRLFRYVRRKFSLQWVVDQPLKLPCGTRISAEVVKRRKRSPAGQFTARRNAGYYDEGIRETRLRHYVSQLESLVLTAQEHGARITIAVLPILYEHEPGDRLFLAYLQKLTGETGANFANFTGAMQDPRYFHDMTHMNERGAAHFAREYLAPQLLHQNPDPHDSHAVKHPDSAGQPIR